MEENYMTLEDLINYSQKNLYLILEETSQENVLHNITKENISVLYKGTDYEHLANLSPILYLFEKGDSLLDIYAQSHIIKSVFFSPHHINEITHHFKNYLTVLLPNKREAIFRFYSPKVLEILLNSSHFNDETKYKMFSPFSSIFVCLDGRFKKLYQNHQVKNLPKEKTQLAISQPLFDEIEESYYDSLLHSIAFDIYLAMPYDVMHIPKKDIIRAIDQSFQMLPKSESLSVKKKFILYRFKYASHYFLLPEFVEAKEKYSLEYALQKLSFNKNWQQKCKEAFDNNHWLETLENSE